MNENIVVKLLGGKKYFNVIFIVFIVSVFISMLSGYVQNTNVSFIFVNIAFFGMSFSALFIIIRIGIYFYDKKKVH